MIINRCSEMNTTYARRSRKKYKIVFDFLNCNICSKRWCRRTLISPPIEKQRGSHGE